MLDPSKFDVYPKALMFLPFARTAFAARIKILNSKNRQNAKHRALNLARRFAFLYKRQKLADKILNLPSVSILETWPNFTA